MFAISLCSLICWLAMLQDTESLARNGADPVLFFLSPLGDDQWSGTLPSPNSNGTDGPWATLKHARDVVRKQRLAGQSDQPLRIRLRGGRYELAEPLVFLPEDSGTATSPTIFEAYQNEFPILSGGRRVTGWKHSEHGDWHVELSEAKGGGWPIRHVSVDGEWRSRPRLPRKGHFTMAGLAGADPSARYDTPANRFEYSGGDIDPAWTNLSSVEVVVLHFWVDSHLKVASIDAASRTVTLDRFSRRRFTDDYKSTPARYYVQNVFEVMEPGDFYLNEAAGRLHYRPREGESVDRTEVVVPRLNDLIEFRGDPGEGKLVEHVTFRGITFSDTVYEPPGKDAVDGQAASSVPGAIVGRGARHCSIEDCRLRNLGGYAIELREGCRDWRIAGNTVEQIGAGGVKISGGAANSPEGFRTGGNEIRNNHLHHLGQTYHSAVGILLMHAAENTIAHNHIHHLYYTAISVGWVWGYAPSVSRGNRIEFNHLHDVGQKRLSDMGGVYLLGVSPGTVVRNNWIHDIEAWGYGGWGIYTDEGSTGIVIENNLVYRTTHGGFHQHYGRENVVRNNIFALARDEQIARSRMEQHLSFTFERNIVYYRTGQLLGHNWKDSQFAMDYNVYYNASGEPVTFPAGTLEQWQMRGFDRHSLIADPRFADADRDDFTLRPDSPALRLGFQPIDLSQVGPRDN